MTRNIGKLEHEIEEAKAKKDIETVEIKEKRLQLNEQRIETLERERRQLERDKKVLEEEIENDIGSLEEELIKLKEGWSEYNFKRRRALLNFAIQEVKINKVSTHWIEVQIYWLNAEWGQEHMYYRRNLGAMKEWKDDEKTILEKHYATISIPDLMALLPDRTLYSIRSYAKTHDLTRQHQGNALHISLNDSYKDWEFENSKGISEYESYTNWEALY